MWNSLPKSWKGMSAVLHKTGTLPLLQSTPLPKGWQILQCILQDTLLLSSVRCLFFPSYWVRGGHPLGGLCVFSAKRNDSTSATIGRRDTAVSSITERVASISRKGRENGESNASDLHQLQFRLWLQVSSPWLWGRCWRSDTQLRSVPGTFPSL